MKTNRFLFAIATIGIVALSLNSCKEDNTSWYEEVVVTTGDCVETSSASITIANNRIDFAGHEKESFEQGIIMIVNTTRNAELNKREIESGDWYNSLIYNLYSEESVGEYDYLGVDQLFYVRSNSIEDGSYTIKVCGLLDGMSINYAAYCKDASNKIVVGEFKSFIIPELEFNCDFENTMLFESSSCALIKCSLSPVMKEDNDFEYYLYVTKSNNNGILPTNAIIDYNEETIQNIKKYKVQDTIVNGQAFLQDTIYDLSFDKDYDCIVYAVRKINSSKMRVISSSKYKFRTPKFTPVIEATVTQEGVNVVLNVFFKASVFDLKQCSFHFYLYEGINNQVVVHGHFNKENVLKNQGVDNMSIPVYRDKKFRYVALIKNEFEEYKSDTINFVTDNTIQIPNVEDAVDLGLSIKWAPYDVGSSFPEDDGYSALFAWGEVKTKNKYSSDNYSDNQYAYNAMDSDYDAATYNWGNYWRTPTEAEWLELIEKCTFEDYSNPDVPIYYKSISGKGYTKVTGPNGNSILFTKKTYKRYMSATTGSNTDECFYTLLKSSYESKSDECVNSKYNGKKWEGYYVRPVLCKY